MPALPDTSPSAHGEKYHPGGLANKSPAPEHWFLGQPRRWCVSGVRVRLKPIAQSQPEADLSVIFGCYFTSQTLGVGSLVLPFDYVVCM